MVDNGRKKAVFNLFLDAALKTVACIGGATRSQDRSGPTRKTGPPLCCISTAIWSLPCIRLHVSACYSSSLVADRAEFGWDPTRPDEQMLCDSKIRLSEASSLSRQLNG